MTMFYLSFGDEQGWRGGCFVEGDNGEDALWSATKQGLNLGGEVLIVTVPEALIEKSRQFLNKHIGMKDMNELFDGVIPIDGNLDGVEHDMVCEHHNPVKGGRA